MARGPDTPFPHVDLWQFLLSPRYQDLYIIGQVELFGPVASAVEAQARLATAMVTGRVPRPTPERMHRDTAATRAWQAENLLHSDRHILMVRWMTYVDALLAPLGANPTVGRVLASGNPVAAVRLFFAVYFGVAASAQWRLFGHGNKAKLARDTIMRVRGGKREFAKGEKAALAKPA